jgi:hypothetical protein
VSRRTPSPSPALAVPEIERNTAARAAVARALLRFSLSMFEFETTTGRALPAALLAVVARCPLHEAQQRLADRPELLQALSQLIDAIDLEPIAWRHTLPPVTAARLRAAARRGGGV